MKTKLLGQATFAAFWSLCFLYTCVNLILIRGDLPQQFGFYFVFAFERVFCVVDT